MSHPSFIFGDPITCYQTNRDHIPWQDLQVVVSSSKTGAVKKTEKQET
jgi:hypothetical protein